MSYNSVMTRMESSDKEIETATEYPDIAWGFGYRQRVDGAGKDILHHLRYPCDSLIPVIRSGRGEDPVELVPVSQLQVGWLVKIDRAGGPDIVLGNRDHEGLFRIDVTERFTELDLPYSK